MNVDFNVDADHIDIPLKKYNLTGFLFIFLGLLVVGIWLVVSPSTFISTGYRYTHSWEIFILGLSCIVVSTICTVPLLYQILVYKSGLTINEKGIIDHSSLFALGFIKWDDIEKINNEDDKYPVSIIIFVNEPEIFIKKQHNVFRRYFASDNYKRYGGPVAIDAYQLKCDYDELSTFLIDTLNIYKENSKR